MPKLGLLSVWPPEARLRALIERLAVVRGEVRVATGDADDLADPVNEPVDRFRRCARELAWMTDLMIERIAPA
jgi:hypothetical protein